MAIHSLPSSDAPCIAPVREGLPPQLKERDQWVLHRGGAPHAARHTERRNGRSWGRGLKVDYTDDTTLATFEEAWQLYVAGRWDGVGYSILEGDPYLLIDIDHCLRQDGTLAPTVHFWVQRLGGYVERSPGADGIHVIIQATLPRPGNVYWLHEETLHETFKVEVYDARRYVRLTGVALPGRGLGEIAERQEAIDAFIAAMVPSSLRSHSATDGSKARSSGHKGPDPDWQPVLISPAMDDAAVLARARAGRYGAAFGPLYDHGEWDGDHAWAKDTSDSGKDHFVINELAYWSQDPEQIERLMRASALDRPKYDAPHYGAGSLPYLQDLILRCLAKKERHYGDRVEAGTPSPNGHNGHHDAGETTTPPPNPKPSDSAAAAWEQLAKNAYLTAAERNVLPALIGLAGYQMGEELPLRTPIGFIRPEVRRASGICTRYWEAALPRLTALGVLTRTRRPSEANPGRRWYSYTLIGSAINGQLQTLGQERIRRRALAAKKRPPIARARAAADQAELEALRAENAELRAWKQHHERCWICDKPLAGTDHVHASCRSGGG